jgi:geranylgeranyl diphosphate synthase type II
MNNELNAFLARLLPAIEGTLDDLLPSDSASPVQVHRAMRYSTFGAGKRIRPCLCVAAFTAYRDDWKPILPVASAVELIHSYSLIHDDLPAMDDDDLRRGKPSCHKQFGEAIAILAGDALLTLAFEVLSRSKDFPADCILRVISMLSRAAGTCGGMIAGQVMDLEAQGAPVSAQQLQTIHRSKTGALIGASVWIGAYLAGATDSDLERITGFCDRIGLAFQVIDDVLDAIGGKDREQEKATYPALHGLEKSRRIAHHLMEDAKQVIAPFGRRGQLLVDFCDYLENRSH